MSYIFHKTTSLLKTGFGLWTTKCPFLPFTASKNSEHFEIKILFHSLQNDLAYSEEMLPGLFTNPDDFLKIRKC